MSKLGFILTDLVTRAEAKRPPCPTSTVLKSGLKIAAYQTAQGHPCLSLTRTASQKPSQKEAEVCADHLGWAGARIVSSSTRAGLPCLLVWPAPVTPAPAPTCGTCDHWTPTSPSMGECQLGWEAHDNLRDSRGRATHGGHGALLLPEMQAGCNCAATLGGKPGYVACRRAL